MEETKNESGSKMPMIIGIIALLAVIAGVFVYAQSNSGSKDRLTDDENRIEEDSMVEDDEKMMEEDSKVEDDEKLENEAEAMKDKSMNESDVEVIDVEGGMFYFKPNELEVEVGQPVKIVLTSVEGMHDFVIDEFNAKTTVAKAGETVEVTFTPTKAGEYKFYCSVGEHRAQGMEGTLIVEE